jgi:hypothetical protein
MTVAELIEELGKFPPHHRVFVEHPDINVPDFPEFATDYSSVANVIAGEACTVIIDATGGMQ